MGAYPPQALRAPNEDDLRYAGYRMKFDSVLKFRVGHYEGSVGWNNRFRGFSRAGSTLNACELMPGTWFPLPCVCLCDGWWERGEPSGPRLPRHRNPGNFGRQELSRPARGGFGPALSQSGGYRKEGISAAGGHVPNRALTRRDGIESTIVAHGMSELVGYESAPRRLSFDRAPFPYDADGRRFTYALSSNSSRGCRPSR